MRTANSIWHSAPVKEVMTRIIHVCNTYQDRVELEQEVGMRQCSCGIWFFPKSYKQFTCGHEKK